MNQLLHRLLALARERGLERERLAALVEAAPDAIVVTDGTHRIVQFNAAAARLFAVPSAPMRGKPLRTLLAPGTYAQYLRACGTAQPPGSEVMRGDGRRRDGTRCRFEYTLSTFSDRQGNRFHTLVARPAHPLRAAPHDEAADALFRQSEMRQAAIARELHDAVGSSLAGVSLLLATASSFAREPEAAALITRSQKQVTMITQQVRQISRGMLPAGQDRGALLVALDHFGAEMSAIPGVHCTVRSRGDFEQVPAEAGNHLYRIVQEATANALRHGHASCVRITLARSATRCRLTVQDDGQGCELPPRQGAARGMGIRSMRARAEAIGGSLVMQAGPRGGTRVQVTWDLGHDAAPPHAAPAPGLTPQGLRPAVR